MAIEELDDIVEEIADKLGVYSEARILFVSVYKHRIRKAMEVERLLRPMNPKSVTMYMPDTKENNADKTIE